MSTSTMLRTCNGIAYDYSLTPDGAWVALHPQTIHKASDIDAAKAWLNRTLDVVRIDVKRT